MKAARIVDPAQQPDRSKVFFGATVTVADEQDRERTITIVGDDEADVTAGRVGWNSPFARALRGAATGDVRRVRLPSGDVDYEVIRLSYPA
jgi:transcription elongation factor GreB